MFVKRRSRDEIQRQVKGADTAGHDNDGDGDIERGDNSGVSVADSNREIFDFSVI
jgi:hypothetical protein